METNLIYDMYIPTRVMFGAGMLDKLSEQPMPGRRALIVISNGKSTRANGYLARTEAQLHKAGVETVVFDGVMPNPTVGNVNAGAKAARDNGCDFLVALGGGSVMDCAKAIAVMATNEGELWDYVPIGSGKGQPIAVKPLPIIAITTTAGTGSETDSSGVITKEYTHEKAFVGDASLFPVLSIVDAELMKSVPPAFTAYQGFDALFHSTEGYIAKGANLMSDMYALEAIRHIAEYLPRAVKDGITEQELAEAKRGLIEYRAVNRAQDGTLAGSWINFMESGRDWSFSKDMEVAIEKLTVKDVNAAIRRIADPSKMTFVLAADLAKAREAGKDFSKQ